MSLKDQLLRLKKCRRAAHSEMKGRVRFGDTEDMDEETILELIPIQTPYTKTKSLFFDRQRQTEEEERKFNRGFSEFLKELVRYGNVKDIEYLFEYLVRRYMCDTFNPKEMIFFLLPFKKYYGQVLCISQRSDFNYFSIQPTYSYQFIGNLCLREKHFFDFFVGYFEHFKYIQDFCLDVTGYIVSGIKNTDKDFSMQFYEMISHLTKSGESDAAVKIFFEIRDHVEGVLDEFVELLEPYFAKEYLMSRKLEEVSHKEDIPHEESALFRKIYDSGNDRQILRDSSRYKDYVMWLHREELSLKSINEIEIGALKTLCGIEEKNLDGEIFDYINLFRELEDKKGLVKLLSQRFPKNVSTLIPHMGDADKAYLSEQSPWLWESLITEGNYSIVVMNMPRKMVENDLMKIMKTCLKYVKYDGNVFVDYLDEKVLFSLMDECQENVFVKNIIDTAKLMNIDLATIIIQKEFYTNPAYLNYLSEKARGFEVEMSRRLLKKAMEFSSKAHMDALCGYLQQVKDEELINDVFGWLIDKMWFYPAFYSGLRIHLEVVSKENCEKILSTKGFSKDNYDVVDRLYRYKEEVIDECLVERHHDALLSLCRKYGFCKILGNRRNEHVVDFIETTSKQNLLPKDEEDFIRYSSSLVEFGGERIVKALFQSKYIPHLIKCTTIREWNVIKVIVSELVLQYDKYRQFCFDYFLGNFSDFKGDLDLFETIVEDEASIDYQKLMDVAKNSDYSFRSSLFDILLRKLPFDSLQFVPMIAPCMIEHKKESVRILFEKHKNIMGPYVKDILQKFPELQDCMLEIDSRYLLTGAIKAYVDAPDEHHLDFMHKVLDTSGLSVSPSVLIKVVKFLGSNVSKLKGKLLTKFFEVYLKVNPEADEEIQSLLRIIYERNRCVFFQVSQASFSLCFKIFKPYADVMVKLVEEKDKDAISFITDYLYWDSEYGLPHRKMFEILFLFYCDDPDVLYARCIGSILRHNPKEIEDANDLILNSMKGDKTVIILKLLQVLYQKVYHFKKCLVKSSPYFALVVDSTRKEISSAARKLLSIIERKHNKSGYQLLQL
ncbi:uncharacterized protein Eint_100440 [Encephalitozoon intestinalis ATCC 50506]|uniref:Uncharacterized protein n=1 Tax=Encephalitozoon intestinalis (strain ATCC 50506) TaxID=876142 RepID=E0S9I5_ENCIT|nr:uncharacterized protein Eint_100440 [Encephalitozoon intestinalis ATCC 50506]ADM12370.1 hypothetical protein Eint_100440 [Encephalitozoon intestinalis ATCC 50506]UTX46202.1 putative exportin [Encephalitozoon intestinalis]